MKHAPRLPIDLQVLCYLDTLSYTERRRLPTVLPRWYTLERVQRIAQPSKRVIQFVSVIEESAA